MSNQRSLLSVAYDVEEDFQSLMDTLNEKPVEIRCGKRQGEWKLWVMPRTELTKEEEERIKKFKDRIIECLRAIKRKEEDALYRADGKLRNEHQVFALAREYFSRSEETG